MLWTCLGGYLASGGAGAINHFIDRKIDARMSRTATRPLVAGRIEPVHGLIFGIVLGVLAFVQLTVTVNLLAAALAMAGLLGYVFVYTAWLKPRTPQNIVIGGAAGAVPPLVGWAAATGALVPEAFYPFGIIFLWTPPHFWALALMIRDDYARTGVPMLPVVKGEVATRHAILIYAAILVAFTILPFVTGMLGGIYLASALVLGGIFLVLAMQAPGRRFQARRPAALPELARLPGAAVRCHGSRSAHRYMIPPAWTGSAPTPASSRASGSQPSRSSCSRSASTSRSSTSAES